jgi:hypothetical protein
MSFRSFEKNKELQENFRNSVIYQVFQDFIEICIFLVLEVLKKNLKISEILDFGKS